MFRTHRVAKKTKKLILERRLLRQKSSIFNLLDEKQDDQQLQLMKLMEKINSSLLDAKLGQQWTVIHRRQDDSVSFNRNWFDYKMGFGDPAASFFIGLEQLHAMTTVGSPQELLIVLIDYDDKTSYAKYDHFRIGSEVDNYALKELGSYSGDAGDALSYHKGKSFTTYDKDNNKGDKRDCAQYFQSGWWYHNPCYVSNLNGPYRSKDSSSKFGVSWHTWKGWDYSAKYAAMMIRSKL